MVFSAIRIMNDIYIFLLVLWGFTVSRRVIHARTRRYLLLNVFFIILWIVIQMIKWEYVTDLDVRRRLWYMYYIPMLMIPVLCMFLARSLGNAESWRLSLPDRAVFAVTGILILMVLTNDLHQLVFIFPAGKVRTDEDYRYGIVYFAVAAWVVLCGLTSLVIMFRKARGLRNKKILLVPFVSLGIAFFYGVLYVLRLIPHIYPLYSMTFMFTLFITVALEGCIQAGLIQSNTHYAELFRRSTIDGQIADRQYRVQLTANDAQPMSGDEVRRTVGTAAGGSESLIRQTSENPYEATYFRMASAPLKKGYVLWKEDVTEIMEVIAELADKSEYLSARKDLLQREVDTVRRERQLEEKNRLYNALMDEMENEIDNFELLLNEIEENDDPRELQMLTKRLAIISTHIKRCSNLIFLAEQNQSIEADELRLAIEEWLSNLRLGGTVCGFSFDMKTELALQDMLFFYDAFQRVLLFALNTVESLFVTCAEKEGAPCLLVAVACGADFAAFAQAGVRVCEHDGEEWVLEIALPAGRREGGTDSTLPAGRREGVSDSALPKGGDAA